MTEQEQADRRRYLTELLADLQRADIPSQGELIVMVKRALAAIPHVPGNDRE